jgi:hypothetical protein
MVQTHTAYERRAALPDGSVTVGGLLKAGWRAFASGPRAAVVLHLQALLMTTLVATVFGIVATVPVFVDEVVGLGGDLVTTTVVAVDGLVVAFLFVEWLLAAGAQYAFYMLVKGEERPTASHLRAGFRSFGAFSACALSALVIALPSLVIVVNAAVLVLVWQRSPDVVVPGRWEVIAAPLALVVTTSTVVSWAGQMLVPIHALQHRKNAWASVRDSWREMKGWKRRWVLTVACIGIPVALLAWIPIVNLVAWVVGRCWMRCTAAVMQLAILGATEASPHGVDALSHPPG